jgi:hypothetical protein
MRMPLFQLFAVVALSFFSVNVLAQDESQPWPDVTRSPRPPSARPVPLIRKSEPQQVTLFSRITHKDGDYGRSAFSFYGVRSDDQEWLQIARNRAHLMYGSISMNRDTDWFSVSMGGSEPSRIKDLGEMQWVDVVSAPFLPANPRSNGGVRAPGRGESFELSSDERVTKVVAGHMYVVHIKNNDEDFYAMFRVESLDPSDRCTISWRVMASPKR